MSAEVKAGMCKRCRQIVPVLDDGGTVTHMAPAGYDRPTESARVCTYSGKPARDVSNARGLK
jgi:hypothetical protein